MRILTYTILVLFGLTACGKDTTPNPFDPDAPKPGPSEPRSASIGVIGDTTDVQTNTRFGLVIMGGGRDVDAALQWMIERSGGGDVVVIRASGSDAYNSYIYGLGKVNSVETLKIDSRKLAENDGVARIIRNAEMLFIAGGDQSDYTGYWKGTKVMDAIDYLIHEKKVPVGGTSAGAAILGHYYFSAERGGLTSEEALSNPYNQKITLGRGDFLRVPFMQDVVTDQHFSQREREGRTGVFLGRILKDWGVAARAIAVDEATAVGIDEQGRARVFGRNKAFFVATDMAKAPEIFESNRSVTWNQDGKAFSVTEMSSQSGSTYFDMNSFEPKGDDGIARYWWAIADGSLVKSARD